jgi:hypothetical protein
MRHTVGLGLALAALGAVLGAQGVARGAPGGIVFSPPPGWLDLSPGTPPENRKKAPPAFVAQADSHAYAFLAVDVDHADDDFAENVNAVVRTGVRPGRMTVKMLDEFCKAVEGDVHQHGVSYALLKKELVQIDGVTVGRIVGDVKTAAFTARSVSYAMTGDGSQAMLTFSTSPAAFARYEPIFDAAAKATRGLVEPPNASESLGSIVGGIAGALGATFGVAAYKRKKKATTPAA